MKPLDGFNDELTPYIYSDMKKVIITVEDTEEEAGVIQSTDDTIEVNFESDEIPMELHEWIMEHVGHRPDDRG